MRLNPDRPRAPGHPRRGVLVDAGHYTLRQRGDGERVDVPGGGPWIAATTETTRSTFSLAASQVKQARHAGEAVDLGLLVGDLSVPFGARAASGPWAIPESYRGILAAHDLVPDDVQVFGEAYCRNQGKRRLLDEARQRFTDPRSTYESWGWALLRDHEGLRLASDASLEWDGDLRWAALTRGVAPLCPLVFAGLKRAVFQAGYAKHVAVYARADDAWIDVKLRAASAIVAQLRRGDVGEQVERLILASGAPAREASWSPSDLVGPGERPWPAFLAEVRRHHPDATPEEAPCPTTPRDPNACGPTKTTSGCST